VVPVECRWWAKEGSSGWIDLVALTRVGEPKENPRTA